MSKNIFKKICLALSIILACSFVPSMMICSAGNIVEKLGKIEVDWKKEVCFNSICGEMYGVKLHPEFYSDIATAIVEPSNHTSEYNIMIKYNDSTERNIGLKGPWNVNFSTKDFPDPIVCVSMMENEAKDTFSGAINVNSDKFTCTSAASLIAPIGTIVAAILGLLVL